MDGKCCDVMRAISIPHAGFLVAWRGRRGRRGEERRGEETETVPRYGEVMVEMWFGRARDDGTVSRETIFCHGSAQWKTLSQSIRSDEGELLTRRGREEDRCCVDDVYLSSNLLCSSGSVGRYLTYPSYSSRIAHRASPIAHRPPHGRREVFPFGIIWGRR